MKIECIKGFLIDGGAMVIMQGEVFKLNPSSDLDEMLFTAMEGACLSPGMNMEFTPEQLCNNFMLVVGK
jgi:hypothetical protein